MDYWNQEPNPNNRVSNSNPIYRVFGNEGYTESGSKLIYFRPNFAPYVFFALFQALKPQ